MLALCIEYVPFHLNEMVAILCRFESEAVMARGILCVCKVVDDLFVPTF